MAVYSMEWETVATRWAQDNHAMLQPATPCWTTPVAIVNNLLKQKVAKKELDLCALPCLLAAVHFAVRDVLGSNGSRSRLRRLGVTSGNSAAAGALIAGGAKTLADEGTMET
jgi:hypothetical protein